MIRMCRNIQNKIVKRKKIKIKTLVHLQKLDMNKFSKRIRARLVK
jgi:hypothetical protein